MNSSDNFGRFAAAAAVICTFLVFGAGGAQATSKHAVAASGPFAAQASSDNNTDSDSSTPSDEASSDNSDQSSDSDTTDSDTTNSDSDQSSETPTEPTFGTPTTSATDDSTEMPTDATGETSEAGHSPLGWILLGGGVACAVAAFLVYRRNRHIM